MLLESDIIHYDRAWKISSHFSCVCSLNYPIGSWKFGSLFKIQQLVILKACQCVSVHWVCVFCGVFVYVDVWPFVLVCMSVP